MTVSVMLTLTYDAAFEDGCEVYECFNLFQRSVEPAGRSFELFYADFAPKKLSKSKKNVCKKTDEPAPSETRSDPKKPKSTKAAVSAFRLDRVLEGEDLYALLNLPESSTEAQLKQSYRQMVLKAHPDKQTFSSELAAEQAKQNFLKLQAAFEILSDPARRRQYDCSRPFDETIPSALDAFNEPAFYKAFGAAFSRNARWSNRLPVPELGTQDTPYATVERFYSFWFGFDSWRDFPNDAEHDLSQAACREEKRWMERENLRNAKKLAQDERGRLMRLVETAQKLDPRVARVKAEEQRKKEEEKRAREEAKEAAELAKREAEMKAKEAKEAEEKKKADDEVRRVEQVKMVKNKIRQKISEDLYIYVKNCNSVEELEALWAGLERASPQGVGEEMEKFRAKNTSSVATAKKKLDVKKLDTSTWTPNELALFAKAMYKFQVGVPKRWEQVANFIGTRSVEETVAMNKRFAQDKSLHLAATMSKPKTTQAAISVDDWTETQQKALEQGLKQFPPNGEGDRWTMIAEHIGDKSKEQCVARFRYLKELMTRK